MKHVIITGASRGIGFEMAQLLANEGHSVLALSRNQQPLSSLKNPNITCLPFDISTAGDMLKLSQWVTNQWRHIDIVINNAGKLVNKPFSEITSEEFLEVYQVNVLGVASLIKTILPFMSKEGHVVNISSMGGVQGSVKFPGLSAYSSSKGALITLTELLAEEYKEPGPSFNVLALGAVQTEMLEEAFPGYKASLTASEMAQYIVGFALTGHKYYNGKLLQVSNSTP